MANGVLTEITELKAALSGELTDIPTLSSAEDFLLVSQNATTDDKERIHLPRNSGLLEVALSPSSEKLLIEVLAGADPTYPEFLRERFSYLKNARSPQRYELWTYGLNGSHMKQVGVVSSDREGEDVIPNNMV